MDIYIKENYSSHIRNNENSNCPICEHSNSFCVKINDGGSDNCENCGLIYHFCKKGKYVFGSPGPYLCENCKKKKYLDDWRKKFYKKKKKELCPVCNHLSSEKIENSKIICCESCYINYHFCNKKKIYLFSKLPCIYCKKE